MEKRFALSSTNPVEEACLHLANQLIRQSKISVPMVSSLKNIDSYFTTLLFEGIFGNPIPDLLPFTDSINEVHNVQAVIDTLSLDILGISLSHITGEDIVAGKVNAIFNLLEVFEGILLFISPEVEEARGSLSPESVKENKLTNNIPERPKGLFVDKLNLEEASNSIPTNVSIENLESGPRSQPLPSPPNEEATAADSLSKNVKQQIKSDFVVVRETGSTDQQVHDDGLNAELQSGFFHPQPAHILEDTSSEPLDAVILKGDTKPQSLTKLPYTGKKTVEAVAESYKSKELKHSNHLKGSQTAKLGDEKASRSYEVTVAKTVRPPPKRIVRKRKALKSLSVDGEEIPQNQGMQAASSSANEQTEPKGLSGSFPLSQLADENNQTDGKTENKSASVLISRKIKRKKSFKPVSVDENKIPKNKTVEDKYEENLENKIKVFLEQQNFKQSASKLKITYKNAFRKPMHKKKIPLCNKSFLLPTNLRRHRTRSSSSTKPKRLHTSISPSKHSVRKRDENEPAQPVFIQNLQEDFPCVHFSPHTVRCMTEKNENHLITMHRQVKSSLLKKPKSKIQLEEASKRQEILSSMLKNELQSSQRLNQLKQDKKSERKVGYSLRDARLRSVRTQRYFKDFHEDMKKKLQSRNIAEEMLIKNVHDEALNIEKEQVRILCKRAKEMDQKDAEHNKRYLDSLENFYQIQYDMFSESLAVEKRNMEERAKAQKSVLQSMERDMREQLISEVTDVQQQVVDSQRDIHFRELDAQRYLEDKRDKYSAGIR